MTQEQDYIFTKNVIPARAAIEVFVSQGGFVSIREENEYTGAQLIAIHPSDIEKVIAAMRAAKRAINHGR